MLFISFLFYLGHNLNISDNPHAVSERDPCVWLFVYALMLYGPRSHFFRSRRRPWEALGGVVRLLPRFHLAMLPRSSLLVIKESARRHTRQRTLVRNEVGRESHQKQIRRSNSQPSLGRIPKSSWLTMRLENTFGGVICHITTSSPSPDRSDVHPPALWTISRHNFLP